MTYMYTVKADKRRPFACPKTGLEFYDIWHLCCCFALLYVAAGDSLCGVVRAAAGCLYDTDLVMLFL